MRILDKLYFKIKRHLFPPNGEKEYNEGFTKGYNAGRAAVIRELKDKSLYNFSSDELRLGYDYAYYTAKKVEEK